MFLLYIGNHRQKTYFSNKPNGEKLKKVYESLYFSSTGKKYDLNCIFFRFCEVIYKIIYIFAVLENT